MQVVIEVVGYRFTFVDSVQFVSRSILLLCFVFYQSLEFGRVCNEVHIHIYIQHDVSCNLLYVVFIDDMDMENIPYFCMVFVTRRIHL